MAAAYQKDAIVNFKMNTTGLEAGARRVRTSFRGMGQWTQNLRAGLLGMNTRLMGAGAVMVGAGLAARSAVNSYERYANSTARLRGILATTTTNMDAMRGMLQSSEVAARHYGFGLGESAEAMGTLLETGVEAHEAMRYFGTISEFARASNSDLESATQVVVDSMRQFNDQSEEGAQRLAATITVAARLSSTSIPQLQQAFRYAGVELAAMGFKADETAAALGALSSIGLRGTTAGTRLRGAMLALTRITGRSRDVMRDYGLEHERLDQVLYHTDGSLRSLTGVSDQLNSIMADLPTTQARLTLATALFGRRAYAAGVILSGLHERSDDFRRTLERLSDSEENVAAMTRAAEENTRGFGAQMRFARVAAEDFGITFLRMVVEPLEQGDQGFGEYLRDLALATRAAGMSADEVSILGESYQQLTPEMRESGREMRETLTGLAELIQLLGSAAAWIGNTAANWPKLTAAVLIFGSVLRPLISFMGTRGVAALIGFAAGGTALASSLNVLTAAIGSMAIAEYGGQWFATLSGEQQSWNHTTERSVQLLNRMHMGWTQSIPVLSFGTRVIGRILMVMGDLVQLLLTDVTQSSLWQWLFGGREGAAAAGQTYVEGVAEQARGTIGQYRMRAPGVEGESRTEHQARVDREARNQYLQDLVALSEGQTREARIRSVRGNVLLGGGTALNQEQLNQQIESAVDSFRQVHGLGEMADYERTRLQRLGASTDNVAAAFVNLDDSVDRFALSLMNPTAAGTTATTTTPAGDVMVGSTGYLPFPVSAGDMLVHRDELARAVAGGRGALLAGMGAQQQVSATPQAAAGPTEVTLNIDSPVVIDGREVARAVGRHVLQIDQRQGVSTRPGARRRVAETGVQ